MLKLELKLLLDRNKHLEKTLKQRCKRKWKTFTDRVNYGYFNPKDMTELHKTGENIEKLNQQKVTANAESLEWLERKRTYAAVPSKVVIINSKPKNTNKDKIIEPNICKAIYSLRGYNKIINSSGASNCNVNLKSDNLKSVSALDEELVNILASLGKTEINISYINDF